VKQVILSHTKPDEVISVVREMRKNGMIQGKDFDFKYEPATYDTDGWEAVSPRQTVFTFYDEKYATWFALKWT